MYRCKDCGKKFAVFYKSVKTDENKTSYQSIRPKCPFCRSEDIVENETEYCRCCGRTLPEGHRDYCSDSCRKRGIAVYENQRKRYFALKSSPLFSIVREIDAYNREHGTNLSYGQYVATKMPKKEKKNGRKGSKG